MLNRKRIAIIAIIIIGLIVLQWQSISKSNSTKEKVAVSQGTLEEKMTISGAIDAEEKVTLHFQTGGRLTWVGVKEGDFVKKYQTIASLDQREVKKNLEKKLSDYLKTRWDLDQAKKDTYKDQIISDPIKRIIDKYQFDLNKAVLDVELQDLSNEYANLWTPIEGIVTKVGSPYSGVNITPSTAEFEIVNPKTIYFAATADQTEVTRLIKDMVGELILDAYPNTSISGTIKDISFIPKTGETSTVYEVKFVFDNDNSNYKYRISMAGDLSFVVQKKENVLYIPNKFIKNLNGKKYLTVKRNSKDIKIEVETGMETDTETEITSGISADETVYE